MKKSNFWENVNIIRKRKKMLQKELVSKVRKAGFDFSVSSISTGAKRKSVPAADLACCIAKILNVNMEFLLNGEALYTFWWDLYDPQPTPTEEEIMENLKNLEKYSEVIDGLEIVHYSKRDPLIKIFKQLIVCQLDNLEADDRGEELPYPAIWE